MRVKSSNLSALKSLGWWCIYSVSSAPFVVVLRVEFRDLSREEVLVLSLDIGEQLGIYYGKKTLKSLCQWKTLQLR